MVQNTKGDLELPEEDFTYLVGNKDRPWSHFVGRWEAIQPLLKEMLQSCSKERPLRIVDVGSCTGFFSLQAAHRHPEADIVAVEGSVGIGNGTAGVRGSSRHILATDAVQTHLRWIQRLGLSNCFVAPEVWDHTHVTELAAQGTPICDAMFLLSIVHHIDNISAQQYAGLGLSRLDGFIDLLAKLFLLSPRHFVELPNRPWLQFAYDVFGSARSILEAGTAATKREWLFKGPIYTADWFGEREVWILEVKDPMPQVDIQSCPFPLLFRDAEQEDGLDAQEESAAGGIGLLDNTYGPLAGGHGGGLASLNAADAHLGAGLHVGSACAAGGLADPMGMAQGVGLGLGALDGALAGTGLGPDGDLAALGFGGSIVDPALFMQRQPCEPVEDRVGELLASAPTDLLVAHLILREAMSEAQDLLKDLEDLRFGGPSLADSAQRRPLQQPQPPATAGKRPPSAWAHGGPAQPIQAGGR